MKDENGKSKGFGFVCFKNPEEAEKAVQAFSDKSSLYVCEAKTKERRVQELTKSTYTFKRSVQYMNLFVKGFEPNTTKEELEAFFSEFGKVTSIKVMPNIGRAFVCFQERDGARIAKEQAHVKLFKGKHLFINYCEPKELRQAQIEEMLDKKQYEDMKQKAFLSTKIPNSNMSLDQVLQSIGFMMQRFNYNSNNSG